MSNRIRNRQDLQVLVTGPKGYAAQIKQVVDQVSSGGNDEVTTLLGIPGILSDLAKHENKLKVFTDKTTKGTRDNWATFEEEYNLLSKARIAQ